MVLYPFCTLSESLFKMQVLDTHNYPLRGYGQTQSLFVLWTQKIKSKKSSTQTRPSFFCFLLFLPGSSVCGRVSTPREGLWMMHYGLWARGGYSWRSETREERWIMYVIIQRCFIFLYMYEGVWKMWNLSFKGYLESQSEIQTAFRELREFSDDELAEPYPSSLKCLVCRKLWDEANAPK